MNVDRETWNILRTFFDVLFSIRQIDEKGVIICAREVLGGNATVLLKTVCRICGKRVPSSIFLALVSEPLAVLGRIQGTVDAPRIIQWEPTRDAFECRFGLSARGNPWIEMNW